MMMNQLQFALFIALWYFPVYHAGRVRMDEFGSGIWALHS